MSCWLSATVRAQADVPECTAGGSSCEADEESVLLSLPVRRHEGGRQVGADTAAGADATAAQEMGPAVFAESDADLSAEATEEAHADGAEDADADSAEEAGADALTKAEVDETLKLHNQLRKAVGVGPLKWNSKLQGQAQKWADKCQFKHSNSYSSPIKAGENIATNTHPDMSVLMWFAEFGAGPPRDGGKMINLAGHYTAMTWPTTKEIGCGKCQGKVFVCQYANAPPNIVGEKGAPPFKGTAAQYRAAGMSVDYLKQKYAQFAKWKLTGAQGALNRLER